MTYEKKIVILDYGLGNLFSIRRACNAVGLNHVSITSDRREMMAADAVILPGVGAFGDAMASLKKLDLVLPLKDFIESQRITFGLCLGLQLLMTVSYEFGEYEGLDIIPGAVVKFDNFKVPQVCWNQIHKASIPWNGTFLENVDNDSYMYFVHSYFVKPENNSFVLSKTVYGNTEFCSSIQKENLFACQFHPERSGSTGIDIYRNFAKLVMDKN